jgi:hypothetical protein
MSLQLRHLAIRVQTPDAIFGADVPFAGGLNIISAPNTSGKSTCIQSILYAFGLEGMLGPSHDVPLPHAMTHVIEDSDGTEHAVLESHVLLEIVAHGGQPYVFRRYAKNPNVDTHLISVWRCSLGDLNNDVPVAQEDFYVRRSGSAVRHAGFHNLLPQLFGWDLPEVPRFNGPPVPLYMEVLAPLWFVEQRRGWSGIQAQTPTYLGIRDARRRAIEFLLDLDIQDRARRIEELHGLQREVTSEWSELVGDLRARSSELAVSVEGLPDRPTSQWPPSIAPRLRYPSASGGWVNFEGQLAQLREELEGLQRVVAGVVRDTAGADALQLVAMQSQLQTLTRRAQENLQELDLERETMEDAEERLELLEEDIRRHRDLVTLRQMGSEVAGALHADACPTCHRALEEVLLDPQTSRPVLAVDESITFLESQKQLFEALVEDARRVVGARVTRQEALQTTARDLRSSIRAHKDALVAPSATPSPAVIERRISLQARAAAMEAFGDQWVVAEDQFDMLATRWRAAEAELLALKESDFSPADREKIVALESDFREQLGTYGFSSCPVDQIGLSVDDYMPEHEGFELSFDLSASDGIRVIWAYLLGLLEVANRFPTNHPQLLVFDEPRQQAAHEISFSSLLRRAGSQDPTHSQVIFATSEDQERLGAMVQGLSANVVAFPGKILHDLTGSS